MEALSIKIVGDVFFYERFGDSLCRIPRFFVGDEERVHFGAQSDEFQSNIAVQFVFEFSDDLGVAFGEEDVVARIFRCVVQVDVQSHVSVNVWRLDTVCQAVRVGEE